MVRRILPLTLFVTTVALVILWDRCVLPPAPGRVAAAESKPAEKNAPLLPKDAPKHMTLPDGFKVTLFAGEPDVVQPIAFTFDDRGRLWVVECLSYPDWSRDGSGHDRVVIFEDTKGAGSFDKKTVFYDKGSNLSGIALGFGGVWLCSTPNLVFIPIKDGEDAPAGPPQVMLDGWNLNEAKHNVFNSLTWGPDGWLWGCNGIQSNSLVGKPGAKKEERTAINCGVWRYHPTKKVFETVANGTTNPWGLDFDDYGEAFITNCVIKHLWHVIPGAHFQRMYGEDFNPHLYGLMESCADHIHWGGGDWTTSRGGQGAHDAPGGGHAHVGAMVYLGDNFPDEYRNSLFTCNLHGSRVNRDLLKLKGSGYVATHGKDFLLANDPWFRGLAIQYGPDGGVYVSDWTDTGECHNYKEVDRTNGRIYKVTFGDVKPLKAFDLAKLSDAELVKLQLHKNDWYVRHARRLLQERAAGKKLEKGTADALRKILKENPDVTRKLRAMWALHAVEKLDGPALAELLKYKDEHLRSWAVCLGLEDPVPWQEFFEALVPLYEDDPSPRVRLALASGLQRIPWGGESDPRYLFLCGLVAHRDASDANLPLMFWYAAESGIADRPNRGFGLIRVAEIPLIREYAARRLASLADADVLDKLVQLATDLEGPKRLDVLRGMNAALHGRKDVKKPPSWPDTFAKLRPSAKGEERELLFQVALIFDDPDAYKILRAAAADAKADTAWRQTSVRALVQKRDPELLPILYDLLSGATMRGPALRGLAAYKDDKTPEKILALYKTFTASEKADAVNTLASRPSYAKALVAALEDGRIARTDVDTFIVRQLHGYKDKALSARLDKAWGTIRPVSQEKAALMAKYKKLLTPEYLKGADMSQGRAVFQKNCASCHTLFDAGGKVGPELTGSQRANLDYVLENVLDPSAVVAKEYQVTIVTTKDGRTINGIIKREDKRTITLQTPNDVVTIAVEDIDERHKSPLSLMPDGVLPNLKDDEVRDLVAYLRSPAQVPLPK
jgi:putative membrane-bound dehydrogenase-like protein